MKIENKEIYEWLEKQQYQTEYEETGEYKMYFSVDMPKILNDFLDYINYSDDQNAIHL